jgi:hypothetical protein
MSIKDYNDGYSGKRRTPNPLSPTGSASSYAAGQAAAQNAARNRVPTFTWPSPEPPKRVVVSPPPMPAPSGSVYREAMEFEDVVAGALGFMVAGLILAVGVWGLKLAPGIPAVAACVAGYITWKLFQGILRPLLVVLKYLLKIALYVGAAGVGLILLLESIRK